MKRLVLKYDSIITTMYGDRVVFTIKWQSHRGNKFSGINDQFICHNGVLISSAGSPDWCISNKYTCILFVRGCSNKRDNIQIRCPEQYWCLIKEAVRDYNNYFGYEGESIIGELKPIPKEMFEL